MIVEVNNQVWNLGCQGIESLDNFFHDTNEKKDSIQFPAIWRQPGRSS